MPAAAPPGPPNVASHKRRTTHFWQSHLTRKRALYPEFKSGHVYSTQGQSGDVPHPLRLFPAPRDRITTMWISKETKRSFREYERVYPWVAEEEKEADGHYGILVAPTDRQGRGGETSRGSAVEERQAKVRRAWRMLARRGLMAVEPLRSMEALQELKERSTVPTYVMVRTDVLAEHIQLEGKLRQDRQTLREQCTWYFSDSNVSAREAVPLVKMAVDEVCDREMAEAAREHGKLCRWRPHRANALVLKPPLPKTSAPAPLAGDEGSACLALQPYDASQAGCSSLDGVSSLSTATESAADRTSIQSKLLKRLMRLPMGSRFTHVTDLQRQIEKDLAGHELELMRHEEALNVQTWRWQDAWERKRDYETYYTLSHVFGVLSQELFDRTARPGRFYYEAMSRSARGFQRMWRARWPPRKRRKLKAVVGVQTLWRAYCARRRWRPIVRLRFKYGYRTQMRERFTRWFKVVRAHVAARQGYESYWLRIQLVVLLEWSSFVCQEMRARKEAGNRMCIRIRQRLLRKVVGAWSKFTKNNQRIKYNFVRLVNCPYVRWWYESVQLIKRDRMEMRLAIVAQSLVRGAAARRRYRMVKGRVRFFNGCVMRLAMMKRLRARLEARNRAMVLAHVTRQRDAAIAKLVAKETRRLQALADEVKRAEAAARRHARMSEAEVEQVLVAARHDFEAARPPPLRASDPGRRDTFVMPEHYEMLEPQHSRFHLLLLDGPGVAALTTWLSRLYGASGLLWTLHFWLAVEGLRGTATDHSLLFSRPMRARLLDIVDKHLSHHCGTPTQASPLTLAAVEAAATKLRGLGVLALGVRRSAAYGGLLQQLFFAQHEAFLHLLSRVSEPFFKTLEGKAYLKAREDARYEQWRKAEEEVLAQHRAEIRQYSQKVKKEMEHRAKLRRKAVLNQAESVVEAVEPRVVDELLAQACGQYAAMFNDRVEEVFIDVVNGVQAATVRHVLDQAVRVVAEEEYVEQTADCIVDEFVTTYMVEDLVDEWVSQEVDSWLHAVQELCDRTVRKAEGGIIREMLAEAADVARREAAILTLQCFFRRRLAIKRARHQVSQVIVKRWDPDTQLYYYMNVQTGESWWDKPRIVYRLFPLQAAIANASLAGGSVLSALGGTAGTTTMGGTTGPPPSRPRTGSSAASSSSSTSSTPRPPSSRPPSGRPSSTGLRPPAMASIPSRPQSANSSVSGTSSQGSTSRPPTSPAPPHAPPPPHQPPASTVRPTTASSSGSSKGSSSRPSSAVAMTQRPPTAGTDQSSGSSRPSSGRQTSIAFFDNGDLRPATSGSSRPASADLKPQKDGKNAQQHGKNTVEATAAKADNRSAVGASEPKAKGNSKNNNSVQAAAIR